jgi:hypothetical protein
VHPHRSSLAALSDPAERTAVTASGLLIVASTAAAGPTLDAFYAGYDEAFVLPNEKEEREGFAKCLALNSGADYTRLSTLYGAFREAVLIARDPADGAMVGGANFIAFPLRAGREVLSINLNYIFIAPAQRRRGHFKRLVAATGDIAASFFEPAAAALPRLVFIEQNDPVQMSRADYERDTRHSGIDQMARIRLWTALGARIVDFPYVQPPLSAGQACDATLIYAVLGAEGPALDACLLHGHLLRFFGISVFKGVDPNMSEVARAQLEELADRCARAETIPLLTAANLPPLMHEPGGAKSLRDIIRLPA